MSKQQRRPAKSLRATRQKRQLRNRQLNPSAGTQSTIQRMTMAASTTVPFKYIVHGVLNNIAGTRASNRYNSDAYDVDPSLGSTAMPGFTEWATLYQRFRTLSVRYQFDIANNESFNVMVLTGFSAGVTVSTGSLSSTYAGNPYWKTHLLGPLTGMNKVRLTDKKTATDVFGTKQVLFDDLYTGSTTSSTLATASNIFTYVGIIAGGANVFANGVEVLSQVTLWVQLYRPNFLTT